MVSREVVRQLRILEYPVASGEFLHVASGSRCCWRAYLKQPTGSCMYVVPYRVLSLKVPYDVGDQERDPDLELRMCP